MRRFVGWEYVGFRTPDDCRSGAVYENKEHGLRAVQLLEWAHNRTAGHDPRRDNRYQPGNRFRIFKGLFIQGVVTLLGRRATFCPLGGNAASTVEV